MRQVLASVVAISIVSTVAAGPPTITVGADFRRLDRETCALRAIKALTDAKMIHAEIDKDGHVLAADEKTVVRVMILPLKDGANVFVAIAGEDGPYNERLRENLRTAIGDTAVAADAPRSLKSDGDRKPIALKSRWGVEQRVQSPVLRFLVPTASLHLEKQGLKSHHIFGSAVLGAGPESALAVIALPGPNEINFYLLTCAFSADDAEADRLQNTIRTGVLKTLFE